MNRRGFLRDILAAAVAPAIIRVDALMRVRSTNRFGGAIVLDDPYVTGYGGMWLSVPHFIRMPDETDGQLRIRVLDTLEEWHRESYSR